MSHDACHNTFDGVKYAHGLNDWLADAIMTVSLELGLHPRGHHISWCHHKNYQKKVVWFPDHVLSHDLGSKR